MAVRERLLYHGATAVTIFLAVLHGLGMIQIYSWRVERFRIDFYKLMASPQHFQGHGAKIDSIEMGLLAYPSCLNWTTTNGPGKFSLGPQGQLRQIECVSQIRFFNNT